MPVCAVVAADPVHEVRARGSAQPRAERDRQGANHAAPRSQPGATTAQFADFAAKVEDRPGTQALTGDVVPTKLAARNLTTLYISSETA